MNQFGRRNLTLYQRTELVMVAEPLLKKQAKANQGSRTDISQNSVKSIDSQKELAKLAHVSHDTIAKAKVLMERADTKTQEKLREGTTTINAEQRNEVTESGRGRQ